MKYLLNRRSFISLMILFSFFDNFGMKKDDYTFRVVFVGDAGVGKTQIINKFMKNSFKEEYKPTTNVKYSTKEINFNEKNIKLELWDTSEQENCRNLVKILFGYSHLIVLVYAIDNENSFNNIQSWVNDVKKNTNEKTKFLLVGNKCDLKEERQVSREEAEKYAGDNGIKFFEVSAKNGTNINDDMFNSIIQDLLDDMEAEEKKEEIQVKNHDKDNDDMSNSIIQELFDDIEAEEKKEESEELEKSEENNNVYKVKVVFVGDTNVGKTQIINKFAKKQFDKEYKATFYGENTITEVNFKNKKIQLQLWDTPGQKIYRSLTKIFYKGSQLIVLVYTVDDKESFNNIKSWVEDVTTNTNEKPKFLLVGNKLDLENKKQVTKYEAEKYAEDNKMEFIEVSAYAGTNIENMFDSSLSKLLGDEKKEEKNNHTYNIYNNIEQEKLSFNGQNKDIIAINKNSCYSEYCPCCPCLEKIEGNGEEEEEVENDE